MHGICIILFIQTAEKKPFLYIHRYWVGGVGECLVLFCFISLLLISTSLLVYIVHAWAGTCVLILIRQKTLGPFFDGVIE